MRQTTLLLVFACALSSGYARPAAAQGSALASRTTVMIVVEPNRTRIGGRDLRAAVTRRLQVIAVPVSFPRATEATAWVAVSSAEDGKLAMRIRRSDGRGASRVERAPREHALEWLVEGVRWLLAASDDPDHPDAAIAAVETPESAEAPLHAPPGAEIHHPLMANEVDLDHDLAEHPAERHGGHQGADGLTAPTP